MALLTMSSDGGATTDGSGRPVEPIRIGIADGRRLIGQSLAALIGGIEGFVVTAVHGGDEPVTPVVADRAGLWLIGVGGDRSAPLELARSLRRLVPDIAIVLLADAVVPDLATVVLHERLNGLILTDTPAHNFAACLDHVAHGHAVLPASWHEVLARTRDDPLESLSERQIEVLELVAEGLSYEEIGARLFISPNTVKFHLRTIFLRLGVRNRMAAARMLARREGPVNFPVHKRRRS